MGLLEDFEKIIQGGFKENTIYLLRGPPGSGKTVFTLTLLKELLDKGSRCVYLTTELTPEELKTHAKRGFGLDFGTYEKAGKLRLIDGCSWKLGKRNHGIVDVSDLSFFSHTLSEILLEFGDHFFVVFDSLTSLLLYNETTAVAKFMQVQVARWRAAGISALVIIEEGVNDEQTVQLLSYFVDGIFETRLEAKDGLERRFRVLSLKTGAHRTDWIPFAIDKDMLHFQIPGGDKLG
jgi:circadian clock protein KaiC